MSGGPIGRGTRATREPATDDAADPDSRGRRSGSINSLLAPRDGDGDYLNEESQGGLQGPKDGRADGEEAAGEEPWPPWLRNIEDDGDAGFEEGGGDEVRVVGRRVAGGGVVYILVWRSAVRGDRGTVCVVVLVLVVVI